MGVEGMKAVIFEHDIEHNYVWAWRELSMGVIGQDKTDLYFSDLPRV